MIMELYFILSYFLQMHRFLGFYSIIHIHILCRCLGFWILFYNVHILCRCIGFWIFDYNIHILCRCTGFWTTIYIFSAQVFGFYSRIYIFSADAEVFDFILEYKYSLQMQRFLDFILEYTSSLQMHSFFGFYSRLYIFSADAQVFGFNAIIHILCRCIGFGLYSTLCFTYYLKTHKLLDCTCILQCAYFWKTHIFLDCILY